MTTTRLQRRGADRLHEWLRVLAAGLTLGLAVAAGLHVGVLQVALAPFERLAAALTRTVGPVWVPMLAVLARVVWLAARAFRSRIGVGPFGAAVRPELSQLAPLFAAFGLAGTVWGLMGAFDALEGGEFLDQLPKLLGGLGTAMTSTLVGLGLQILTLLIAAYNPAWSQLSVAEWGDGESFVLDGTPLGEGDAALAQLREALRRREPEALHLHIDPRIPEARCRELYTLVWESLEGGTPLRRTGGGVRG